CASLRGGAEVLEAREERGVHVHPREASAAQRAGERHRRHRQRGGSRRSLDEFTVGAHARLQCAGLITW
ncbi:VapC toxin family PIN domain ribonuclease, partial [Stenotrophomonas maltophilia]